MAILKPLIRSNMNIRLYITAVVLSLSMHHTRAQEVATQLALGATDNLDTYLSPEKYSGFQGRFMSEVVRSSAKRPMAYILIHEGTMASTHNRAETASEISGGYDFSYTAARRFNMAHDRLRLLVGAMAHYSVGFAYNTRTSSNNPAQGYMSVDIGPHVMLNYDFTLWGKAMRVNWEARLPLVGVMFSPNYGQSYYEIFNRGDYDHNIVVTSVAVPQLRHHISLDIPFSARCALRVGYLGDYRQAKPNNLKQHNYYNAATIGVVVRK